MSKRGFKPYIGGITSSKNMRRWRKWQILIRLAKKRRKAALTKCRMKTQRYKFKKATNSLLLLQLEKPRIMSKPKEAKLQEYPAASFFVSSIFLFPVSSIYVMIFSVENGPDFCESQESKKYFLR